MILKVSQFLASVNMFMEYCMGGRTSGAGQAMAFHNKNTDGAKISVGLTNIFPSLFWFIQV